MNKIKYLILTFFLFSLKLNAQKQLELGYTLRLLDPSNRGQITPINHLHISLGTRGGSGLKHAYACLMGGVLQFNDKLDVGGTPKFPGLYRPTIGAKFGYRPIAKYNCNPIQPIIEVGGFTTVPKDSMFNTFHNLDYAVGLELYTKKTASIVLMGQFSNVIANGFWFNNYAASISYRKYFN
jgi:hypothetical protein